MRIAVVSDSHGNIEYLSEFAKKLRLLEGVDVIIHLGDDSPDIGALEGFKVISVPGVYETIYSISGTRRRLIEEFEEVKILITHTPTKHSNDIPGEPSPEELSKEVNIVLYGHTHIPKIEAKKGVGQNQILWINPGHMKKDDKRGYQASYAILDIQKNKITIKIFDFLTDKIVCKYPS